MRRPQTAMSIDNGRLVKSILQATWQAIGSDAISSCREVGTELELDSAIELICDAQRAEDYARTDAEKAALAEFRLLPWDQQCKVAAQMLGPIV